MFKRVYYTLRTLLQHPRYWRGIIACPHAEPLHYHHDGCPACFEQDRRKQMDYLFPSDEEMDKMAEYYK